MTKSKIKSNAEALGRGDQNLPDDLAGTAFVTPNLRNSGGGPQKRYAPNLATVYLAPPAELNDAERKVWNVIVRSRPPAWFTIDQVDLIKQYVLCVVQADDVTKLLRKVDPIKQGIAYVRLTNVRTKLIYNMGALSKALRIAPSSVHSKEAAGALRNRRTAGITTGKKQREDDPLPGAKPWET